MTFWRSSAPLLLLGAAASLLPAQESESHIPLDSLRGATRQPADLAKQFNERMGDRKPSPSRIEPETLKRLLDVIQKKKNPDEAAQEIANDRDLMKLITNLVRNDPEVQRQLQE